MPGYVSTSVMLRPVRVGLAFEPTIENVLRAVEHATSAWGGVFYPLLSSKDESASLRMANLLDVDVIFAVDDSAAALRLAELPGYRWRGSSPYGPFDPPSEGLKQRVVEPPALIDPRPGMANRSLRIAHWETSDPLNPLYAVWFGRYYSSDYGEKLAGQYAKQANMQSVDVADLPPEIFANVFPIGATSEDIEYWGDGEGIGFFLLDASNPIHLMAFWNLRAAGANLFPIPSGENPRFISAAATWLDAHLRDGNIPRYMRGTGEPGELYVRLHGADDLSTPERLTQALAERNVEEFRSNTELLARGWRGSHPLHTDFSKMSTASVERNAWVIDIPTPAIDFLPRRDKLMGIGIVAAQIDVFSEVNLPQGAVLAVPNRRSLADLLSNYVDYPEPFHRPTGDGRVIGIRGGIEHLPTRLIPSLSIFESFLEGSSWTCSQSDNGRFSSRLIDLLGGIPSQSGNQPSVRAVLSKAARSTRGQSLSALLEFAKKHQGMWPGVFASAHGHRDYPKNVVYSLLAKKLLRPTLPLRCPHCGTESTLTPEDLRADFTCEMCGEAFPLGLALALSGKTRWHYKLAGNLPDDRLAETFPIMAALTVLSRYRALSDTNPPHVIGLKLQEKKDFCEIDLATALDDGGLPIVVIAEAKSFRDSIDTNDLANLVRVREYLRAQRIETFILVATMRDELHPEEVQALRKLCEEAPETLSSRDSLGFAFPVILMSQDLSVPEHSAEHPMRWDRPSFNFADFAISSCKKNLGLLEVMWQQGGDQYRPVCKWESDV